MPNHRNLILLDAENEDTTVLRNVGTACPKTRRRIREEMNLQHRRCENFKFRMTVAITNSTLYSLEIHMEVLLDFLYSTILNVSE